MGSLRIFDHLVARLRKQYSESENSARVRNNLYPYFTLPSSKQQNVETTTITDGKL